MKRWYQLSVFQLLVMSAVIAIVCAVNARMRRREIQEIYSFGTTELIQTVEVLSAGWPFTCFERTRGRSMDTPQDSSTPRYIDTVYWGALLKNLIIGLGISGFVTATSEFFPWRTLGFRSTSIRTRNTTPQP